jgi:acyl-[acyl-carrier-protein]-phospholipid O-acyltransferase / long-chain-fatty-acid--[acyl-carrier-protein] ligase
MRSNGFRFSDKCPMKGLLRFLLRILLGYRAFNEEVLKTPGPVLLIPNHTSWIDWLFLLVLVDEDWKCVVSSVSAQTSWLHRKIMINRRTFPIDTTSPYAVKRMAEFLEGNGRLVLFAEGRLSRTGTLMKLFDGTGFLLHKTRAKIITCYLRNAYRLPFSPNHEEKKLFPRVTAHFSGLLTPPHFDHMSTSQARNHLTDWLRHQMVLQRFQTEMEFGPHTIPEAIIEMAREREKHVVLQDLNQKLSFERFCAGASLFAEHLQPLLGRDQARVGVLLPNVNATPLTLLSLWLIGRVPAILNYTTGPAIMLSCCQLAGLKQVITSRAFLERAQLNVDDLSKAGIKFVYLENVRKRVTNLARLVHLLRFRIAPTSLLRARVNPNDTAVILFTSGSEGIPKGVELTHTNILANVRQFSAICDIQEWDRLFNALPLFHSFGLTVGTLFPLIRGCYVFLYPSPLHYRVVPTAFYHQDCTIMLATNTFLNGYARKAHAQDFRSLRYMFAGAEKLQESTMNTWARQFGVRVLEGYGATECAPAVSVNTPLEPKHGSAGHLMPGMEARLEPIEGVEKGGRLFVRGPNVMKGYLNADANAKFKSLDGWYDTGDIVYIDEEGFFFIQGRLKRFAKISGEMVSLTAVEEALAGAFPQYGLRCQVAVVTRPDQDKGEALIAVTNEPRMQLDEIRSAVRSKGLPNICAPREVRFLKEIPRLGTGKVNHRELEKTL